MLLLVGGLIGYLVDSSGDSDDGVQSASPSADATDEAQPATSEATGSTSSSSSTTAPGGSSELTVSESGFTGGPDSSGEPRASAGAVVVNNGDASAAFIEVLFTFNDASGTPVASETAYLYAIDPGGKAYVALESVSLQAPAEDLQITVIDQKRSYHDGTVIPVEVSSVAPRRYGGLEIAGTASNPTSELLEGGSVDCVLRSGGTIVGGASAYLDPLVPDGQSAWDTSTYSEDWLAADSTNCSAGIYD